MFIDKYIDKLIKMHERVNLRSNRMLKYTLIFIFDKDDNVLLIERTNNPAKGELTGLGGHIEKDEHPRKCAHRELMEEAGFDTHLIPVAISNTISSHIFVGRIEKQYYSERQIDEGNMIWLPLYEAKQNDKVSKFTFKIIKKAKEVLNEQCNNKMY